MEITLTPRHREVLNYIAQGDEIIINLAKETTNESRYAGLITRTMEHGVFVYSVTPKGFDALSSLK